jgi:hypothetical protein
MFFLFLSSLLLSLFSVLLEMKMFLVMAMLGVSMAMKMAVEFEKLETELLGLRSSWLSYLSKQDDNCWFLVWAINHQD